MPVFQPTYKDPKTSKQKFGTVWWYDFIFAGKRIRESAKTTTKTLARMAEQKRRRELEEGFNGLADKRDDRIKTIQELSVERHLGNHMAVEVTDKTVREFQSTRLKEKAAPKSINEEVGFLLRLLGEQGDGIRAKLRRQKALKLAVHSQVGKAFTTEEKEQLLAVTKTARSPAIYPALMLALNAGMRDAEIRTLQWDRVNLPKSYLVVAESKTEAGEGRTIPLNTALAEALVAYSKWYAERFGAIQPGWYVFPFGKPRPQDPTRPMVTLKTAWNNAKKKANVKGRWHDNRHTFITGLAESGEAGDETIRDGRARFQENAQALFAHRHGSQAPSRRSPRTAEGNCGRKTRRQRQEPTGSQNPCQRIHQSERG
jgi:integrase